MHSRITFYVYAKIGQVNGGGPPRPLNPPLGLITTAETKCAHKLSFSGSLLFRLLPQLRNELMLWKI